MNHFDHPLRRREFLEFTLGGLAVCVSGGLLSAAENPAATLGGRKFVVGHRGACAYAPENTLPSYRLAMKQKADFVEQDLQVTKDKVLVCSHDETLERVTNVADVFPDRFVEETVKSKKTKRWHFHDFTVAEIKQLDAGAKFNPSFKGTTIPTWQEAIDEIKGKAGLCPEIKSPEIYHKVGINIEELFVEALRKNGLDKPVESTPLLIQCFTHASLKKVAEAGIKLPMLELSGGTRWSAEKMELAKECATALGPSKDDLTPEIVKTAHDHGLQVVAYTYNAKNLGKDFKDIRSEIEYALYELGVDGLFTDNPDMFVRRG